MSSFNCPKCKTPIIDSNKGYITGCKHYPLEFPTKTQKKKFYKSVTAMVNHLSGKKFKTLWAKRKKHRHRYIIKKNATALFYSVEYYCKCGKQKP